MHEVKNQIIFYTTSLVSFAKNATNNALTLNFLNKYEPDKVFLTRFVEVTSGLATEVINL